VQIYSIRILGLRGFLRRFTKPFEMAPVVRALFVPLNVIEELVKPITLSLRLFGNIFAGEVMIFLLTTKFPVWASWIPVVVWKFFDVFFVGSIQAFIFMLLTVIYFGMAREGIEEMEGHHHAGHRGEELAHSGAH
jgi:F-type H+-transporting ATPase subunit a